MPIGLEAWRLKESGRDYVLFEFPLGQASFWAPLTPRERSVASEVLRGLSNREVAKSLGLAPRTVANHLASIFRKLHIGSRAELASLFSQAPQKSQAGR